MTMHDERCFGLAANCTCPRCKRTRREWALERKDRREHEGAVFSLAEMRAMERRDLESALLGFESETLIGLVRLLGLKNIVFHKVEMIARILTFVYKEERQDESTGST